MATKEFTVRIEFNNGDTTTWQPSDTILRVVKVEYTTHGVAIHSFQSPAMPDAPPDTTIEQVDFIPYTSLRRMHIEYWGNDDP